MAADSPSGPKRHILAATPTCFIGFDPWVAYRYFQRAGIRYVEVPAFPATLGIKFGLTTFAPEALSPHDVQLLLDGLRALRLTPLTVGALCNPLESHEAEAFCRRIDFAKELGAPFVLGDVSPEAETGKLREELVEALRRFGDYAAERGVRIALETHEGPTRNGRLAQKLLAEVNHPSVGFNYDTGNICYYNEGIDPAEDIKEIADRVIHVHLKDTSGGKGQWQFCALGAGHVNFPKIIQTLESAGYEGPYSLEIEGLEGEDLNREQVLQRVLQSIDYLRGIGLQF